MGADTPGHGPPRASRPAGKRLPEKRQGFLIYLPQTTHAKLKAEARRRAVTMSELALTALAQFLAVEESPPKPVASQPFIGEYGQTRPVRVAAPPSIPESSSAAGVEEGTFEVED